MAKMSRAGSMTIGKVSPAVTPRLSSRRIKSLDGLRGLAALTVVIDHCLITNANFSQYLGLSIRPDPSATSWWVTYSPLHVFWSGTEAVYLFFVLSGLVLALPWTGRGRPSWMGYYPARLVRLYLPVLGAVGLAAASLALVPRHAVPGGSTWLSSHALNLSWTRVLHDAYLLHGTDNLNGPFWSLEWEVLFSLFLPLFIVGGKLGRTIWPLKLLALMAAMVVGFRLSNPSLQYMPMFGIGVLMAFHWDELFAFANRPRTRPERLYGFAAFWALLFFLSYWLIFVIGPLNGYNQLDADIAHLLAVIGSAVVIFLVANWSWPRRFCERPPVQWAGKRSFSIYLVHEPIVVSAAFLLGGRPNTAVMIVVALPAALFVANIFYRLIERPAIDLSHIVGGWTSWRPLERRHGEVGD